MNRLSHLLVWALLATAFPARGADLTLTDGRIFADYTIKEQTPTAVVVRHAKGISKIEKKLLPPDVLAQWPIDEAGAAAEAKARERWLAQQKQADAQRKAKEQRHAAKFQAENERIMKAQMDEYTARLEAKKKAEELRATILPPQITAAVQKHALKHYKTERRRELALTLSDPVPVTGWPELFDVAGVVTFAGGREEFVARVDTSAKPVKVTDFRRR